MNPWKPTLEPVANAPEEPPIAESDLDLGALSDIEAQQPLPGRQRAVNSFTYFLIGAVALLGSFTVGAWFQREHGPTTVAATTGANPQTAGLPTSGTIPGGAGQGRFAAPGGTLPNGGQIGATGAGAVTIGTVKLVDGNNVYVTDQNGTVVKITTQPGLAVQVSKPGTIADLSVGETVIVQGTTGSDGAVAATAIQSGTTGLPAGRGTGAGTTTTR